MPVLGKSATVHWRHNQSLHPELCVYTALAVCKPGLAHPMCGTWDTERCLGSTCDFFTEALFYCMHVDKVKACLHVFREAEH